MDPSTILPGDAFPPLAQSCEAPPRNAVPTLEAAMNSARSPWRTFACALLACTLVGAAHAEINPGQVAPPFTKNVLNSNPWPTASLSQFLGQVVILHIIGFD